MVVVVFETLRSCLQIDGLFFHQPPSGNGGQLFTSGQRKVAVWRREEIKVHLALVDSLSYSAKCCSRRPWLSTSTLASRHA